MLLNNVCLSHDLSKTTHLKSNLVIKRIVRFFRFYKLVGLIYFTMSRWMLFMFQEDFRTNKKAFKRDEWREPWLNAKQWTLGNAK